MDRREALKRTALVVGGILSAPTIAGILNGCTAKPTINWKPQFLSEDQGILISQLSEIIIPKTDTPGAIEVGVPGFIDIIVKDVFDDKEQTHFMKGLDDFSKTAAQEYGDPFIELSAEDQTAFVKKTHDAAIKNNAKNSFILKVKELTVAGFFTSEVGATQVLQYQAVPGAYKGCLPISETGNGKTWAT
jgi:gluconate 2-dehydrogenase gamma chain